MSSLVYTACIKDDAPALETKGSPFIKILEAPTSNLFFSPFTTIDTVDLFSLRREEVSEEAINNPVTITLTSDPAVIEAFNTENGTSYEALPDSLYTIVAPGVTKEGNTVSMTIDAGVIGKEFKIALNGAKWDVSHSYAMNFIIADSASKKIRSGKNEIFVTLASKNAFDGYYTVKGYLTHPTAEYTGPFSDDECGDFALLTTSPNSVDLDPGQPFSNAGELSIFGVYPRFIIDPVTYKVTVIDAAGSLASLENFSDYDSRYDPDTKTLYVKYGWNGSRVAIDTFTYCGPR